MRRHGALGDGQTDDTDAIQQALLAAASAPVAPAVLFPAGTYRITRPLLVPGTVVLEGEPGATLAGGAQHDLLYIHGARRILVRNLSFRGGKRQICISPGDAPGGTVALYGCAFVKSAGFAVDCAKRLDPGSGRGASPYRLEGGALVARDEGSLRLAPAALLLRIDACSFEDCRQALAAMCEMAVVENSFLQTDETMQGGAIDAGGRLELRRVTAVARPAAGRGQHWVTARGGALSMRDCTFRSHGAWGLCAVHAWAGLDGEPGSVVIDGCLFAAAGNEEGCLVHCHRLPRLVAVRRCREAKGQPLDILGFAQPVALADLADPGADPKLPVAQRYVLDLAEGNRDLAAHLPAELAELLATPLPEGTATAFQTTLHRVPPEPAKPPKRLLDLREFGAAGDGVADDSPAMAKALRTLRTDDELLVPPGRYRLARTVRLPSSVSIRGEGWPVFAVDAAAENGFEIRKALSVRLAGCAFEGGTTALRVGTAPDRQSSVQIADCAFSGTSGPAVVCLAGAGRPGEPNRSRLRVTACEFRACGQALQTNFDRNLVRACVLMAENDADRAWIASMGSSMVCESILGAGGGRRWLDVHARLLARGMHPPAHGGETDLIRALPAERGEIEVFVEDCRLRSRGVLVRSETLPRVVAVRNCMHPALDRYVEKAKFAGFAETVVHASGNAVLPAAGRAAPEDGGN